jgi:hypothetical protein
MNRLPFFFFISEKLSIIEWRHLSTWPSRTARVTRPSGRVDHRIVDQSLRLAVAATYRRMQITPKAHAFLRRVLRRRPEKTMRVLNSVHPLSRYCISPPEFFFSDCTGDMSLTCSMAMWCQCDHSALDFVTFDCVWLRGSHAR